MKDYRRRRTGATLTQAGPATINGSTFGNHVRIIQGNLNIFRSWGKTDFPPHNKPSETVQAQLEEKEKTDCRRSLVFRDIDARLHDISPVQPGTCEWVFEMPLFQKWYDHSESDNGLLWIKGNPGTGKSTLIKHIFQYCRAKEEYVIAAYFFNARGAELEQTPLGMLRSLLFQLLKDKPCLYDQFLPIFRKKRQDYVSDDWEWREPELKSFCLSEIPKCQPGPLLLIIDALDECSEADVQNVAEFLQDLRNNATDAGLTLKICLSSRHYPFIRFKAYQELVLEKEKQHEEDIAKYISSNLTHKDEEIEESIRKRSSGIFMWVVLVISILNRAYQDGKIEGMKKRLNQIPTALGEMFAMMLEKNNPDKDETVLILQWVLFAERLLTPEEIYFAIIAGTNREALGRWDPLQITPDIIRRRIISSSRGLVEIRKGERIERSPFDKTYIDIIQGPKSGLKRENEWLIESRRVEEETVQFIHESVRDFLFRDSRLPRLDPGLMPGPWSISHDRLKDCCVSYLFMESLELQNIEELEFSFPFIEYASRYLFDHAEWAPLEKQTELLRTLKDNTIFKRVERFHSHFVDYGQDGSPLNLLQILAARNLPKLAAVLINMGADINAGGIPCGTALEAAIDFRSERTVKMLLSKGAKIDPRGRYIGDTTLQRAFQKTNRAILTMLIEKGATLNYMEKIIEGNMLQQAIEIGHKDIIAMMLDKGAKINARAIWGNALCRASLNGYKDIAEMLLEKGAKIDSRGLIGSPLACAALNGHVEVAKMLIDKGAKIHTRGVFGSPLQGAAMGGFKGTVDMLLNKGAKINAWGGMMGNALHGAVLHGNKEIVEMLLEKGANINARGLTGPGYMLMDDPDNVDKIKIQEMLLAKGIKMGTWGKVYGTALQAAAAKGYEEIVQLLLDRGAKR